MKRMAVPRELQPADITYKGMAGPWLDSYFDRHIKESVDGWTLVPIYWNALGRQRFREGLAWFEAHRNADENYFTIVLDAVGLPYAPEGLLVFGASNGHVHIPLCPRSIQPAGLQKTLEWNFVGSIARHVDYRGIRRRAIQACRSIKPNVVQCQPVPFKEYCDTMESSAFTLAPRGFGPTSFRLYESMAVGSVPIYVWTETLVLPYQDEVDWDELSVVIRMDELNTLRHRLASVDPIKSGERAREFYNEYCRTASAARRIVKYLESHSTYRHAAPISGYRRIPQ